MAEETAWLVAEILLIHRGLFESQSVQEVFCTCFDSLISQLDIKLLREQTDSEAGIVKMKETEGL